MWHEALLCADAAADHASDPGADAAADTAANAATHASAFARADSIIHTRVDFTSADDNRCNDVTDNRDRQRSGHDDHIGDCCDAASWADGSAV